LILDNLKKIVRRLKRALLILDSGFQFLFFLSQTTRTSTIGWVWACRLKPAAPRKRQSVDVGLGGRWAVPVEDQKQEQQRAQDQHYHLEHKLRHGKKHLALVLMTLNLLAFGLHTLLEPTYESRRLIRTPSRTRGGIFTSTFKPSRTMCVSRRESG